MTTTPKPDDSREEHLKPLGKALQGLKPGQQEQAVKIAAKLLAIMAAREARPVKAGETD